LTPRRARRVGLVGIIALGAGVLEGADSPSATALRDRACRANNRGVAQLEQFQAAAAVTAFREALALAPDLALARTNLGLALFNAPDLPAAARELAVARGARPDDPATLYASALVARAENRVEDAEQALQRLLTIDPVDVGALVNLGQMWMQARRLDEAERVLRAAVSAEPYNATALYNLGIVLTRAGRRAEGQAELERFQKLKESGAASTLGQSYPDQGRYAEAQPCTGSEGEALDARPPAVTFVDASATWLPARVAARASAPPPDDADLGDVTAADVDGDGDLDLIATGPGGLRLWRNDGTRFEDTTRAAGLPIESARAALPGDLDGDGHPDLLLLRAAGAQLWKNNGAGRFEDASGASGWVGQTAGARAGAALLDADHDGDLDVVMGSATGTRLWRNDGAGRFTDSTLAAGLGGLGALAGLVPTDFDNRRDIDLLAVPLTGAVRLYRNLRDQTFRDEAEALGFGGATSRCVAAGDIDKDGATDFFLCGSAGPDRLMLSNPRGRLRSVTGVGLASGSRAALMLDYDGDGLLDLLALADDGLHLWRNLGQARFQDVTTHALPRGSPPALAGVRLAAGDWDADGDSDLALLDAAGGLRLLRNDGPAPRPACRVRLAGRTSNRGGVGAKVELRAGSLWQKLETYVTSPAVAPVDLVFGLGTRAQADAVRVLWPSGTLQAELPVGDAPDAGLIGLVSVQELDRKPSSCPFLFAWDGHRFRFVTDFMGGGEMGYWLGPGDWNVPDPDEYVRLDDTQLQAREGRYELRVTNELEEALFVDHLRLLAVTHPADVEVHPNEGLLAPPLPPFRLHAVRDVQPLAAAYDDAGQDVTAALAQLDRRWPDGFALHRLRGYAAPHTLTLDLGGRGDLLLLTAWTDYAFSSDNVAAAQLGLSLSPPALQVRDAAGVWQTVIEDIGIPVGRPQTLVVDLQGRWLSDARQVRLLTNMRIYWDWVRVATPADVVPELQPLELARAELRVRGFSKPTSPDGREPFGYDYEQVSLTSPWKVIPGAYTRPGDVRTLLAASDDLFVIALPGDELVLSFEAPALSPLGAGERRTYLLYSDGFSKEMDPNAATPHTLEPLPFHGMSRYPYESPERYPLTPERAALLEHFNTRVVRQPVPLLATETTPSTRER
jgi:Tfp pilus assembly protein PilF